MGTLPPELVAEGTMAIGPTKFDLADPGNRRRLWGRQLALLPQEPALALDPTMRVRGQVAEGAAGWRPRDQRFLSLADQRLDQLGTGPSRVGVPAHAVRRDGPARRVRGGHHRRRPDPHRRRAVEGARPSVPRPARRPARRPCRRRRSPADHHPRPPPGATARRRRPGDARGGRRRVGAGGTGADRARPHLHAATGGGRAVAVDLPVDAGPRHDRRLERTTHRRGLRHQVVRRRAALRGPLPADPSARAVGADRAERRREDHAGQRATAPDFG